ncbi:MAG: hypothetical protein WAV15_01735 [Minisyncoccia bacterium]
MDRKQLFKPIIYLALFMWVLDILVQKFYWYYSIWWFDIFVHFLGGFWVGMFFIWFFGVVRMPFVRRAIQDLNKQTLLYALLFVLLVGISWEAGEFLTFNTIGREAFSMIDTVSDILIDLAGGACALIYAIRKIVPKQVFKIQ